MYVLINGFVSICNSSMYYIKEAIECFWLLSWGGGKEEEEGRNLLKVSDHKSSLQLQAGKMLGLRQWVTEVAHNLLVLAKQAKDAWAKLTAQKWITKMLELEQRASKVAHSSLNLTTKTKDARAELMTEEALTEFMWRRKLRQSSVPKKKKCTSWERRKLRWSSLMKVKAKGSQRVFSSFLCVGNGPNKKFCICRSTRNGI